MATRKRSSKNRNAAGNLAITVGRGAAKAAQKVGGMLPDRNTLGNIKQDVQGFRQTTQGWGDQVGEYLDQNLGQGLRRNFGGQPPATTVPQSTLSDALANTPPAATGGMPRPPAPPMPIPYTGAYAGGKMLAEQVGATNQRHRDRSLAIARATGNVAGTLGRQASANARRTDREAAVRTAGDNLAAAIAAAPRTQAMGQLGAQNMAGIQGDLRMQRFGIADAPDLGEIPAADAYRRMQAADPSGPYSGMSGGYSQQRLNSTGNPLNLARTPTVPGEGVTDAIAYNPGAAGSSPFVSDGPLSGGPRGAELQARLDRVRREMGIAPQSTPMMGGSQLPSQRRIGQLGTLAEATRDGGIRLVGPVAQQTMARTGMTSDALAAQRDNIIGGTPTTTLDPETGLRGTTVRALHPEQQSNMDLRSRRTAEVRDFLRQRGRFGQAPTRLEDIVAGSTPPAEGAVQGPPPIEPELKTRIENSLALPDDRGNVIEPSQMTVEMSKQKETDNAQKLIGMVQDQTITREQALAQAMEEDAKDGTTNITERLKQHFAQLDAQSPEGFRKRFDKAQEEKRQMLATAPSLPI